MTPTGNDTVSVNAEKFASLNFKVTFGLGMIVVTIICVWLGMFWLSARTADQAAKLRTVAVTTHNAICYLRADVQRKHDDAVVYLKKHPYGVVSPSTQAIIISADEIQRDIASRKQTLDALAQGGLNCDDVATGGSK
jgi:hypothetical protein